MSSKKCIILIGLILVILPFVSATENITECGGTYGSGVYELNQSISGTGTCLTLNDSNINIDCKGNTISYGSDGANGRIGINALLGTVFLSNITIKNCIIQDTNAGGTTGYGIMFTRVSDSYITNNSIQTNGTATNYGIYLSTSCENNLIENNTINALGSTTANIGIYGIYQVNNNIFRGNNITGTGTTTSYALYLYGSDNNTVENNDLSSITTLGTGNSDMNVVYIYAGSKYNTLRNNYIHGTTMGRNYYVYIYYNSNYNKITNNTINTNGLNATNAGIYILGSDFNEVENNTINSTGALTANYGVWLGASSSMNLIRNNQISTGGISGNFGVYLVSALYNNITENQISASGSSTTNEGISLSSAQRNSISKNNISTNGLTTNYGIYLTGSDYDSIFDNDISTYGTATSTTTGNHGIYLVSSTNNNISHNRIIANGTTSSTPGAGNGNIGIDIYTSSGYNYVYNNTIQTDGKAQNYGMYLYIANRNEVINNQISTNGVLTTNHGIFLSTSSNNNYLLDNNISTYGSTTNHGISLSTNSDGNQIIGNSILTNSSTTGAVTTNNYGMTLTTNCYNNVFENNTIQTGGGNYNFGFYALVNSNNFILKGNNLSTGGNRYNYGIYLSESRLSTTENNIITASGTQGNNYGVYLYSNSRHNLIKNNSIFTSAEDATTTSYGVYLLFLTPINYPHNNTFQKNNFITTAGTEFQFGTATIDETILVEQSVNSYLFTGIGSTVTVKNESAGEIKFLERLSGSGTGFNDEIYVNENNAYINQSNSGFNKSAEITFYNLPMTSTELQIYRNGEVCSETICTNLTSLQAGNVTFNVTGGGSYSILSSTSSPLIELNFPGDGFNTSLQNVNFNFTVTDNSLGDLNCSIYINSDLNQTNSTTKNNILTNLLVEGIAEGNYSWYTECFDSAGNRNVSEIRIFNISVPIPTISKNYPENNYYLNEIRSVLLNYTVYSNDLRNMTVWLYGNDIILNTSENVGNGTTLTYNWTGLDLGKYNWTVITNNGFYNSTNNYFYFNLINLTINCEAGGPYKENALVLVYGNVINGTSGLSYQDINISLYKEEILNTSRNLTSSSGGSFQTSFSSLADGNYTLNTTFSYQGYNKSCADNFTVGGEVSGTPASFALDKIASFYNFTNETFTYNITLKLTNKGGSNVTNVNITDLNYNNYNFTIGTITAGETIQRSYLINFTRNSTIYSNSTAIAQAFGIDSFSSSVINANSSSISLTVPSLDIGQQLTVIKNSYFNSENSTTVNYTLSLEVVNSGGIDLSGININDQDLNISTIQSLNRSQSYSYSSSIIINKEATNLEYDFYKSTATVNTIQYDSNQINIIIPGYGGPADTIVYSPVSVATSTSFDSIIEIINQNLDAGQNFVADYWITDNIEAVNYTSGQQTIYVSALGSTNITATLTSPSSTGTYKLRALVSYIGGPDIAFDSFDVTSSEDTGGSTGASSSSESGGSSITGKVIYKTKEEDIAKGKMYILKDGDKIKFEITQEISSGKTKSEGHSLEIVDLQKGEVTATIYSQPITIILGIGEGSKLDLNNDGYYDLYLKLDKIEGETGYIYLKSLYEKIENAETSLENENKTSETTKEEISEKEPPFFKNIKNVLNKTVIFILLTVLFFLLGIYYLLFVINKNYKEQFYKIPKNRINNLIYILILSLIIVLIIFSLKLNVINAQIVKNTFSFDKNGLVYLIIGLSMLLIIFRRNLTLVFYKIVKKNNKYPSDSVTGLKGKNVYSESGVYIGEVTEIILGENRIENLKIKLDKKHKFDKKGIVIDYRFVKDVSEVVIIDEKISEHLENIDGS